MKRLLATLINLDEGGPILLLGHPLMIWLRCLARAERRPTVALFAANHFDAPTQLLNYLE